MVRSGSQLAPPWPAQAAAERPGFRLTRRGGLFPGGSCAPPLSPVGLPKSLEHQQTAQRRAGRDTIDSTKKSEQNLKTELKRIKSTEGLKSQE